MVLAFKLAAAEVCHIPLRLHGLTGRGDSESILPIQLKAENKQTENDRTSGVHSILEPPAPAMALRRAYDDKQTSSLSPTTRMT